MPWLTDLRQRQALQVEEQDVERVMFLRVYGHDVPQQHHHQHLEERDHSTGGALGALDTRKEDQMQARGACVAHFPHELVVARVVGLARHLPLGAPEEDLRPSPVLSIKLSIWI